ncbi:putative peptidyl-tRNA hydrolase [Clavispora lusitaniae]|uniref:Peptidyl-tRNA hydrolase n=3 Tax=Clavispora lusitaniae TaxID=36911 RepID=C4Y3V9_CLAL4|nr:uncharacterized protein CLUG_02331 [Clavispora lusitaniae ATCC 42720]KAF5211532.1 hypothetical protein E0198_002847 [Clavispora lusitaniae]EEQ38205.1 hypothetical protein CLUG_02331 [Clavispora lusitaniae ATCC 42720]KAF7580390.1 Peptidyl-tRNA hydrolase family protein [Clavispora lusitaniae]OVF05521.1 putative peptidyl-tRNA hydrolase [Clavispora lusitaniae]QFZ27957.1 putative peptidyl-tRNA hydrolase [Clavispora lusitaniae]
MQIVFFSIGNPGRMNRHSTGHYVLQHLVSDFGATQLVKKGKYSITSLDNVMFVKSNAYMNESGESLRAFLGNEKIRQCILVVLFDDFELVMPKVRLQRLKQNESHNGIKSIGREIQSQNIEALKLGVGIGPKPQNASRDSMASWVLSDFKLEEKQLLSTSLQTIYKYVEHIISSDGEIGDCNKLNSRITKQMSVSD